MLSIENLGFDDLSDEEILGVSNNGHGRVYASYIRVKHNGKYVTLISDAMKPKDATFCRDLNWITTLLRDCYFCGVNDAYTPSPDCTIS